MALPTHSYHVSLSAGILRHASAALRASSTQWPCDSRHALIGLFPTLLQRREFAAQVYTEGGMEQAAPSYEHAVATGTTGGATGGGAGQPSRGQGELIPWQCRHCMAAHGYEHRQAAVFLPCRMQHRGWHASLA